MARRRKVVLVQSLSTLVVEEAESPPKIFHSGLSQDQLCELSGCVRKSDPNEFWHDGSPLGRWVGQQVLFVVRQNGTELASVLRVIESIVEKPTKEVTEADLEGTLAAIAMRESSMTFLRWFRDIHGGGDQAIVIRVRKP